MGQHVQSVKHRKASRMHHVPKIKETDVLCNTLMLQKYLISIKVGHKYSFFLYLESLDLGTLDRKWLKDKEIKKPTEETKDEKKITSFPTPPSSSLSRVFHQSLKEEAWAKVGGGGGEVSLVTQLWQ